MGDFDITTIDSGKFDLGAPDWLAARLLVLSSVDVAPEQVDETRLRLVSNLVVAVNLVDSGEKLLTEYPLETLLLDESAPRRAVRKRTNAGLEVLHVDGWLSIIFPQLESVVHAELLINDLNELSDRHGGVVHWALDFSALREMTPSLVGYLLGFNHSLRDYGKRMLLLWVREDAVQSSLLSPLEKAFQLRKKGAFFVSRMKSQH